MIGATVIESEETGPITLRSALDLLSAAYALDPAFAEAEIVKQGAGARPAFPDNRPRIIRAERLYLRQRSLPARLPARAGSGRACRHLSSRPARPTRRCSLQILLNGEAYATDAQTLDELCARLGFAEAKIATAVNGSFVAAVARPSRRARAQRRDRDRGAEAGRLMLDPLRRALYLPAAARHGAISLAGKPAASGQGVWRRDRHRLAAARIGARARRARLLGADRGARRAACCRTPPAAARRRRRSPPRRWRASCSAPLGSSSK